MISYHSRIILMWEEDKYFFLSTPEINLIFIFNYVHEMLVIVDQTFFI